MVLQDRGVQVSLNQVEVALVMPSRPDHLAHVMSELSGLAWRGDTLSTSLSVGWALLQHLRDERGSWIALLEPLGLGHVGHWVVVDGVTDDGVVLVRDPGGAAYGIAMHDFEAAWRYHVAVLEEPA